MALWGRFSIVFVHSVYLANSFSQAQDKGTYSIVWTCIYQTEQLCWTESWKPSRNVFKKKSRWSIAVSKILLPLKRPGLSPTTPVVPAILQHCSMLDSLQVIGRLCSRNLCKKSGCLSHEGELQLHELQEFHGDQRSQRSQWFQSQRFQRSDLGVGSTSLGGSWHQSRGELAQNHHFDASSLRLPFPKHSMDAKKPSIWWPASWVPGSPVVIAWRTDIYRCISGQQKSHDLITNPLSTGFVPMASPCIWGPFSVCLHCKNTKTLRHRNTNLLRLEFLVPLRQKNSCVESLFDMVLVSQAQLASFPPRPTSPDHTEEKPAEIMRPSIRS